jgi:hypothetical protein
MKKKIAHRGHLRNLIKKGMIEAKCLFHYTDDYAYDNAYNNGKTDWMPVEFVEFHTDGKDGFLSFTDWDLKTSSGYLHADTNDMYSFAIHSNLVYKVRIKEQTSLENKKNIDFESLINKGMIEDFIHTKTGEALMVLKLATRLTKEQFKTFNTWLKDNNKGYYSKYAGGFILSAQTN